MAPDSNTWKPPVLFQFSVEFQWGNDKASASFAEVDGLGQELVFSGKEKRVDNFPGFPVDVRTFDITLKRSLEPLDERISQWITQSFNFLNTGWIEPCKLVICLLNEEASPMAAWVCMHAIPLSWKLAALNAEESKVAIETLTVRYTRLIRNK